MLIAWHFSHLHICCYRLTPASCTMASSSSSTADSSSAMSSGDATVPVTVRGVPAPVQHTTFFQQKLNKTLQRFYYKTARKQLMIARIGRKTGVRQKDPPPMYITTHDNQFTTTTLPYITYILANIKHQRQHQQFTTTANN